MDRHRPGIVIDGVRLHAGTSVFHTREHRVLWIDDIEESTVRLSSVDASAEINREAFREKIEDGTLVVESVAGVADTPD